MTVAKYRSHWWEPAAIMARLPRGVGWLLCLLIPAAFIVAAFLLPLGEIVQRSIAAPSFGSYKELIETPLYSRVLWITFRTAALITLVSLLLGYGYAYLMLRATGTPRTVLIALVLLPFWTSVLVRTFAWQVMLQETGVINEFLRSLGAIDKPIPLVRNLLGVTIGMTQILLPFMVLPIYAAMRRIDMRLIAAAETLGATPLRAFVRIFIPLSMPGVLAGVLLVFSLSLGFYITPAILGGPSDTFVGQLIVEKVSTQLDFGVASALGVVLLIITLAIFAIGARFVRIGNLMEGEGR